MWLTSVMKSQQRSTLMQIHSIAIPPEGTTR
jgi:hypothetical protein